MINVSKTFLPPLEEYNRYLKNIWSSSWVTNNGPYVKELESLLKEYFKVKHLFFATNGTIVLQIALKALQIKGEVITTPFSYVATTGSLIWENCTPVFADIRDDNYTIDVKKIEALINPNTEAILATHVYGIPCDVEGIEILAAKHGLKVIYDAAHAFGSTYRGKHLISFGDISTISFHATKLFHTIEGGAIVTNDDSIAEKISLFRSFGHRADNHFSVGINGKNSEFHAAMGLCIFPRVSGFIDERKELTETYDLLLKNSGLVKPLVPSGAGFNYAYYPIIFQSEEQMLKVKKLLEENGVFARRYFYPSLNLLPYVDRVECPISESIAPRTLCLPLYNGLLREEVSTIAGIIVEALK